MTNRIRFLRCSLVLLVAGCAAGLAQAAEPVEVGVAGRIKPATPICAITMPTEVQYGAIAKDKIKPDGITVLDKKAFSASISCDQATKFTVQFVDSKSATAVDDAAFLAEVTQSLPEVGSEHVYGLGLDSAGQKIGAMFLQMDGAYYADSPSGGMASSARPFYREGDRWVLDKTSRVRSQFKYTFAPPDYVAPITIGRLNVDIGLVPVIDSGRLDLSKEIDVAGRITLEISQI
jgi:hypothetical protein